MKIKMLFRIFLKPRRVYRSLLIIFSSVFLYILIYRNELSMDKPVLKQQFIKGNIENGTTESEINNTMEKNKAENQSLKYILLWTPMETPFNNIRKRGRVPFIANDCQYTNCFLTHKKFYFPDQTRFDAIVFSIAALKNLHKLPLGRLPRQKYVAASTEPAQEHPVVNPIYDGYFNWTWTYRLDSDILWRKFRIYSLYKNELGPQKHMKWQKWLKEDSRDHELENFISSKKKSVVWVKNSCEVNKYNTNQLQYIRELEGELANVGLSLATYSNCSGYERCGTLIKCKEMIQNQFYFYLAFEDYIDEDYVSETLLLAFEAYAVPIVFGGADYSRFLPPDCYLDARKLNPREVTNIIDNSMSDYYTFLKYFRWVFHYQYQSTGLESEVCNICTALNNEKMVNEISVQYEFRKFWNGEDTVLFSDFVFQAFEDDVVLKNMLKNGSYIDIRKAIMKRHLEEPKDFVFEFDMENLNITSTDETLFIPDELTSDTVF